MTETGTQQQTEPSGQGPADESEAGGLPMNPFTCLGLFAVAFALAIVLVVSSCNRLFSSSRNELPSDAIYEAAAERLVKMQLRDPESAEFYALKVVPAGVKHAGPAVCGFVNARNGFGGMGGLQRFVVADTVILEEQVGKTVMDTSWAERC